MTVPVFTPVQAVLVEIVVPVSGAPAATFAGMDADVQPDPSEIIMVWLPAVTLLKTFPDCGGPPSNEYVYGPAPFVGVTVIVPSDAPLHEVAVVAMEPSNAVPAATVTGIGLEVQRLFSRIVTV